MKYIDIFEGQIYIVPGIKLPGRVELKLMGKEGGNPKVPGLATNVPWIRELVKFPTQGLREDRVKERAKTEFGRARRTLPGPSKPMNGPRWPFPNHPGKEVHGPNSGTKGITRKG